MMQSDRCTSDSSHCLPFPFQMSHCFPRWNSIIVVKLFPILLESNQIHPNTCIHCQSSWTRIAQSCSPAFSAPPVHQLAQQHVQHSAHQLLFSGRNPPAGPLESGPESCLVRIAGAELRRRLKAVADLVSGKDLVPLGRRKVNLLVEM